MFISAISRAQITHQISLGPDLGIPGKQLGTASVSLGGSIEYQLKFKAPIGIQIKAGYNKFGNDDIGIVRLFPVRAGLVGYLYQDIIFAFADAGMSHYYSPTTGTKQDGFSFGIGAGYKLKIYPNQFLQVSAYYNSHHFDHDGGEYNITWFNIRAAYGLNFGKRAGSSSD